MPVTEYYKKYIAKLCAQIEAELVGESLQASNHAVENFGKFIARTRRRDLIAKISELVDEHVNAVLVGDKFGQHFTDCDADSVEAGKDVVALGSFHKSPEKKAKSVAVDELGAAPVEVWRALRRVGAIMPPVRIVTGKGAPESIKRTLAVLAVLAELGRAE